MPCHPSAPIARARALTRREFLYSAGSSIGAVALSALFPEFARAAGASSGNPHHAAKAKSCIFLMMEGGPSHVDTFDPKPVLDRLHEKEFVREGREQSAMSSGRRYYVRSPFAFRKAGESGADFCTLWENLAGHADDICFYRGCQVDSVNHPTAMYQMNTGNRFGGDPAVGSWVTYGLGSESDDLPGFVVLPELAYPQGGPANWSNGFLPTRFQGTPLRPEGSPILDLDPSTGIDRAHQRANLDLLQELNAAHRDRHPENADALAARMDAYELAFRMQVTVPGVLDIDGEPERVREAYGIGREPTDTFGRKCLLARKLVEKGVRFVQLYAGTWDSHDYIEKAHGNLIRSVDRPIAALLTDLRDRGLLDETLVVWCGEFGRTPDNGIRGGIKYGRDHNPDAMTIWLAGGGVNAGQTIGATDETGASAVDCVHHVRDLHVTLLHLLGLDDSRLTYFHAGRFKQLSQFGGAVIPELLA